MKKSAKAKMVQTKKDYPYPTHFGSHESMIDEEATKKMFGDDKDSEKVVLKDDLGLYVTERRKLDNGLNDYNRSSYEEARTRVKEALK